jgi:AraC-like DNA-binding protein
VIIRCYLPSYSLANVRRAFPSPHRVDNAGTWDVLVSDLLARRCDVAIVDPCTGADQLALGRVGVLAGAMPAGHHFPVVAYVAVTACAMRSVLALVRLGVSEIVIRGVDDSADALAAAVRRVVAASASTILVSSVSTPLHSLPVPVAAAIQMAFHHPERLRTVTDLAAAARTTRRSLDRWLARAGLSPARTVLSCARVNAAFHLLASGRIRVAQAATLLGYASSRSLTRELYAITGYRASAIQKELSYDALTAVIARRLVRHTRDRAPACASSY